MQRARHPPAAHANSPVAVRRWLRWCWAVALASAIWIASSRGQVAAPAVNHFDKVAHFMAFGLLGTLLVRTPIGLRRAWVAVAVASLFGFSDELHQNFTPGRSVALGDWIADTSGALVAVVLYQRSEWYRGVLEWPIFRLKRRIETAPAAVPQQAA